MPNSPDPKLAIHSLALLLLKWTCAAEQPVESEQVERVAGASGSYADIVEKNPAISENPR